MGSSPIYVELASESDDPQVTVIESFCTACEEQGETRLLMTRIPHYREVILTSFQCGHCGNRNNGIQPGGIEDLGVNFKLNVKNTQDLSRQLVKSDYATVCIPEIELEIPPEGEKGEVTTVEGILRKAKDGLNQEQEFRRREHPDTAKLIDNFIDKLNKLLEVEESFTLTIDDPSGNSFLENLCEPIPDPELTKKNYKRTKQQDERMGFYEQEEEDKNEDDEPKNINDEVLTFETLCDKCTKPVSTNMKVVTIPHFKEVIIMATHCDGCGSRTNEVKSGSGISPLGKKIKLKFTDPFDMARDVLKSDTCSIEIPELELYVGGGLIGGKFTTLEGLLNNIRDDLASNPFLMGDSVEGARKTSVEKLMANIDKILDGSLSAHIILDDPAGNSYLQNIYAPDDDPEMTVEDYERTFEQNEDLGLNDMKTENYIENESITEHTVP
ncbi:unnamed protein product [Meganyctiphanes norvegica]|uniref:Zinc finger ZPR1-type domain-containing protein n=1 Tax=Meganyctiphanes norvegica TaxID=48144 RepID=A0AAV2QE92_MEGNR